MTKRQIENLNFNPDHEVMHVGRSMPDEGEETEFVASLKLVPDSVNLEERTCEFVAATGRTIARWWWTEKLVISEDAIDTARLAQGISFLNNHNHKDVHGISEGYRIDEKSEELIMKIRFSEKQESDDIFKDIIAGIRKYVSISYIVQNQTVTRYDGDDDDRPDEYLVTRWQPIELSTVGVPADEASKSRNRPNNNNQHSADKERKIDMPEKRKVDNGADNSSPDVAQIRADEKAKYERKLKENSEIQDLGLRYDMGDQARAFIKEGKSSKQFMELVLDTQEEESRNHKPDTNLDMEDGEVKEYSLFRAIRAHKAGGVEAMRKLAPLEYEAHIAVEDKLDREAQGFYVPRDVQNDFARRLQVGNVARREMQVASPTEGANLKGTDHRGDMFIDLLLENTYMMQFGARVIDNLVGDVDIPRAEGGLTTTWLGEGADAVPSNAGIGMANLTFKTISAETEITRKLIKQSSPSVEAYIIDLIMKTCGIGIDTAAFQGAGGLSILGLMNTPGINAIPVVGTFPVWNEIVDMETAVDTDNALIDNMKFLVHPGVAGNWKKTLKFAGISGTIAEGNEVNGYPFFRKSGLAAETCIFGNFRDWLFGMWGVLDLKTDHSTNAKSGGTVLRAFQDIDGVATNVGSFAKNA